MRRLAEPDVGAEWAYLTCISRIRDGQLKARLESILDQVVAAADQLASCAQSASISTISTADTVGAVSASELADVYTLRLAKMQSPGRVIYDQLMTSAPNDQCPLCGHRQVAALDHFMPKMRYPALSVVPLNLVPCCTDCNKAKLDAVPACEEDVTLHPYFDNVDDVEWLHGVVLETAPASVRFSVVAPNQWSPLLAARVEHHFSVFQLPRLYAAQAAEEMLNIRFDLESALASDGPVGVRDHLDRMARSRAEAHLNSWQTATYKAFASSMWFCSGGFSAG